MSSFNLGEKNELALSVQSLQFQDEDYQEKHPASSNETAKREMAIELMLQGFTEKAICRILNITPDKLPEPLPL